METRPKVLSVQKTVHDLNESHNEFDKWKEYIHEQLEKQLLPTHMLVVEANRIVTKSPDFRPTTRKERVDNDRIIYLLMFITAIALAVAISYK